MKRVTVKIHAGGLFGATEQRDGNCDTGNLLIL